MLTLLIAFFSLIGLAVIHEFGHFIIAKRFGVKVEEFGIGYPPRLFGKKFGETIYSINLLPFGAFVKLPGEIEKVDDWQSFSNQPIWKRSLIVLGGVISFWIVTMILFSIVFSLGTFLSISDDENVSNPMVQIAAVAVNSPAKEANLRAGDVIKELQVSSEKFQITKIKELQDLIEKNKGQEIVLIVERGKEIIEAKTVPRLSPPAGQGPLGVALVRTTFKSYPWYLAIWKGISATFEMTKEIIVGYGKAIKNLIIRQPTGAELMGPVGVFQLLNQASQLGVSYFLQFIGMISLYFAILNVLPIPALDGGKMLFLIIEAIRKKPVSEKVEQNITVVFFTILITLMIWVTIKDIRRLF